MLKCRAAYRWLMPSAQARRTFRYKSTVKILPPSLSPERVKVDDFYAARSRVIPPLPWPSFSPPFSVGQEGRHPAIIGEPQWNRVQALLTVASGRKRGGASLPDPEAMLTGRLVDETGDRLTPTHIQKGARSYRYYTEPTGDGQGRQVRLANTNLVSGRGACHRDCRASAQPRRAARPPELTGSRAPG